MWILLKIQQQQHSHLYVRLQEPASPPLPPQVQRCPSSPSCWRRWSVCAAFRVQTPRQTAPGPPGPAAQGWARPEVSVCRNNFLNEQNRFCASWMRYMNQLKKSRLKSNSETNLRHRTCLSSCFVWLHVCKKKMEKGRTHECTFVTYNNKAWTCYKKKQKISWPVSSFALSENFHASRCVSDTCVCGFDVCHHVLLGATPARYYGLYLQHNVGGTLQSSLLGETVKYPEAFWVNCSEGVQICLKRRWIWISFSILNIRRSPQRSIDTSLYIWHETWN